MVRALVLSDIHGEDTWLRWLLEQVWKDVGPIDYYLCLGDGVRDFERVESFIRQRDPGAVMYAVKGNNDWCDAPLSRVVALGGVDIFMTHGHEQRVKSGLDRLMETVRSKGCAAGLYGHTHCPDIEMNVPLLVNPGAVKKERCALLEIENKHVRARLLDYSLS